MTSPFRTRLSVEDRGSEGAKFLETVGAGDDDHNRNAGSGNVLLEFEILINGQEPFVALGENQPEEFTVALARPSLLANGADFVTGQLMFEWPRYTFVK